MDLRFQFPPEVNLLLIDTIPLLVRSKDDVLVFFHTAKVSPILTQELAEQIRRDRASINKYEIVRRVLAKLDAKGEAGLEERRLVVRRVTEFEGFNSCYPENILKAKGLVHELRAIANVKDSFTRMRDAQEDSDRKRREENAKDAERRAAKQTALESIRDEFFALFGDTDPHVRGKKLESVLNRLFATSGMLVREAFTVKGLDGAGIVEQIDGLVSLDDRLYLVEMKWWATPIDPRDIGYHISKIYLRNNLPRGIYISHKGYTSAAIDTARQAFSAGTFILLLDLEQIVRVLVDNQDFKAFLEAQLNAAIAEKHPYPRR